MFVYLEVGRARIKNLNRKGCKYCFIKLALILNKSLNVKKKLQIKL